MPGSDAADARITAAADELYALPPDEFMPRRTELAKSVKGEDAAAAKAIGALRKPTLGASVVNRYVHHDPDATGRLGELGDRLRRAQRDLDATTLRELTTERRKVVAELTKAALAHAGRDDPASGLRDEVSSTFDAALADPEIAERLGRLVRSEQFSGFGLAPGPGLTLVPGGEPAAKQPTKKKPADKPARAQPAAPRRLIRAAEKARTEFAAAEDEHATAESAEQRAKERVDSLGHELTELQRELDDAKRELERNRKAARTAKSARRQARSALDRAERRLGEDGESDG